MVTIPAISYDMGMGDTFVISGLRNKRARIAGEIAAAQRALDQRRAELAQLDAAIRMFTPDCNPDMIPPIRPGSHGLFFSYGELPRMCLGILREAKGPMRFDHIVDRVILAKGIEPDGHLRRHIRDTTRGALIRMAARRRVRRVLDEPDVWWELVR
jgi:hypothetical protein